MSKENAWIMTILNDLNDKETKQMFLAVIDHITGKCETEFEDRCMRLVYKIINGVIDRPRRTR